MTTIRRITRRSLLALGGAVGRAEPGNGALAAIEAPFAYFAIGFAPAPEAGRAVEGHLDLVHEALAPWDPGAPT